MQLDLDPQLPPRAPGCPPPLELEACSAGEAPSETLAAHLARCGPCARYVATLRERASDFARQRPADRFLTQLERRAAPTPPRRRWATGLAVGLSGLAALVLALPRVLDRPSELEASAVRFKGDAVSVYVLRGEGPPRAVASSEVLLPGDALRFSVRAERPGHAAALGRDGTGRATVLAPFDATRPQPVEAGTTWLQDSAVLDASAGPEALVVVFAERPFALEPLKAQLAAGGPEAVRCDGCAVWFRRFEKAR